MNESEPRRGAFLDLNGTLVLPIHAENPREYRQIPNSGEAVAMLCAAGFVCPVVTVQSRVGKRIYSEAEFRDWFRSFSAALAEQGAFLNGPYVCPHRYATECACKKATGLLYRRAAEELRIDLASSFVIGDSLEDMQAAQLLGCTGVAVRTGWEIGPDVEKICDHVADDLLAAARWIIASRRPGKRLQPTALGASLKRRD